jgi:hypothetical protein
VTTIPEAGLPQAGGQMVQTGVTVPARIDQDRVAVAQEQVAQGVAHGIAREWDGDGPHLRAELFNGRQHLVLPRFLLRVAGEGNRRQAWRVHAASPDRAGIRSKVSAASASISETGAALSHLERG